MARSTILSRTLCDLLAHLERAELTLGEVKATGNELVKANAAFEDVKACQRCVAELEVRAGQ